MKTADFGLGTRYDEGTQTSVAVNRDNVVLEVHKSENEDTLWYRVGSIGRAMIVWWQSVRYDNGITPACALNAGGTAVEVHRSQNDSGLWYRVGTVSNGGVAWGKARKYDSGEAPAVAMNDGGTVVEVHKSQNEDTLWYHVGSISGDQVSWGSSQKYDSGLSAAIALNNAGTVVEVHQSQNEETLWYRVGTVSGGKISFGPSRKYDNGEMPSVALNDAGEVVEVHKSQNEDTLWTRAGVVSGDSITWSGSHHFDSGKSPSVACNGKWAVQTHRSGSEPTLWATPALLLDRSRWMSTHRDALATRTVRDLAFPGSHDAAMYATEFPGAEFAEPYIQTQDTNLHGQLDHGSRYFDLRPLYANTGTIYLHHGGVPGPTLANVLNDVKAFMAEGNGELVILKFSHFELFDSDGKFAEFNRQVKEALGEWFYTGDGTRLADVPLSKLLGGKGVVWVVGDNKYYQRVPTSGFFYYRDEDRCDAIDGDLRVYDHYSKTSSYDEMKKKQLEKLAGFDGKCHPKDEDCENLQKDVPCDLFLLSWTLTPDEGNWEDYVMGDLSPVMYPADRELAVGIQEATVPNAHGRRINVVYLDYVQKARAVDVCMILNGLA